MFNSESFTCSFNLFCFIECVVLSDEEKNENCQQLLASDENSDGKIASLEVC